MTTSNADTGARAEAERCADERLNPIDGLLAMAEELVSDETRDVLAKLPADYFERFRYYAYAPPWERESDTE